MPEPTAAISLWPRAWKRGTVKIGCAVAALFALAGIYGPFLANDLALVWIDRSGVSFPVFTDLLNRWSHPKPYDAYFNVTAVILPFLLIAGWLLRHRWSLGKRFGLGFVAIVVVGTALTVPLVPSAQGQSALWKHRATDDRTVTKAATDPHVWALFPPVQFRALETIPGQVLKKPLSVDEASGRRMWLGTDSAGKDVAAQLLLGARISLTVGLVATGLSLVIGILLGAISGYCGGIIDLLIQRVVEIMMCFPTFILILVVVAMLGRDIFLIMAVIGLTGWAGTARLVRGEFLAQSVRDYVTACEALAIPRWRIMFRHILPNALTPLLVSATFGIAGAVGSESALSFIGLGDPTIASWGALLEQGRQNIQYSWLIWLPGLAVFILVSALNLVGDGLREAADVRRR